MKLHFLGWNSDYDLAMINKLSNAYHVTNYSIKPLNPYVNSLNRVFGYPISKLLIKRQLKKFNYDVDDVIFVKDTNGLGYIESIQNLNFKKVLIIRNIVERNFIEKYSSIFDGVYTFDKKQGELFKIKYVEQICPENILINDISEVSLHKNCYFIGKDKHRISKIEKISKLLSYFDIRPEFFVVPDDSSVRPSEHYVNNSISYNENLRKVSKCDYILEITQENQTGLTLRVLESLQYKKKLISNNMDLTNEWFYDKSRIFIVEDFDNIDKDRFKEFIQIKYKDFNQHELERYNPINIFSSILRDLG